MSIDVRLLGLPDQPLIEGVSAELFDDPILPKSVIAFLADPRHIIIGALDGRALVGFVSALEYYHPDKPPHLWINEVSTASSHRRLGIASRMLTAAFEEGRKRGCVEVWVGTEHDNEAARRLYSSMAEAGQPASFLMYEFDLTINARRSGRSTPSAA